MACGDWIHKDQGIGADARILPARELRETIVRMADPELLAKYDNWLAEKSKADPDDRRQSEWESKIRSCRRRCLSPLGTLARCAVAVSKRELLRRVGRPHRCAEPHLTKACQLHQPMLVD